MHSAGLGAAVVGFCFGTNFTAFPLVVADLFGIKNLGANYGLLLTSYGAGAVIGPLVGSRIYDSNGSYTVAFIIAGGLALIAVGITCALKARVSK